jgi:hypothetical protein
MTSYIANHTKKLRILKQREQELVRALTRADSPEKLERAAQRVRDARIRVLAMKRAKIPPKDPNYIAAHQRYTKEISELSALSLDSILNEFKDSLQKQKTET